MNTVTELNLEKLKALVAKNKPTLDQTLDEFYGLDKRQRRRVRRHERWEKEGWTLFFSKRSGEHK